jgi:hypothetical protein
MGSTVRKCVVLSFTSIAILTTLAWADGPTKQECAEACNMFTAELVGNSNQSVRLNGKQRSIVLNSIQRVAKQCMKLCGFSVIDIDLLSELVVTLRESRNDGEEVEAVPFRSARASPTATRVPPSRVTGNPTPLSPVTWIPTPPSPVTGIPAVVVTVVPVTVTWIPTPPSPVTGIPAVVVTVEPVISAIADTPPPYGPPPGIV